MSEKIVFVGVDVDDKAFHIAGLDLAIGEFSESKCKPTFGALMQKLEKFQEEGYTPKVCYEATYLGYSLCRQIRASGIWCDIIAPSLIPEQSSARVKTDRKDSLKLAEYYAKGLLTAINIPDEEDEQVRSLIRIRSFFVNQSKECKQEILSFCRYNNLHYRSDNAASYWTATHRKWIEQELVKLPLPAKTSVEALIENLDRLAKHVESFDKEIESLSQSDRYRLRCETLCCFKGIQTLSAMTIITELGDVRRFKHPSKLVSYCGMDIREYSSGGKERKMGITKMGNRRLRTVLVEACQVADKGSTISKYLKARREKVPEKLSDIAVRCQVRLRKKSTKMFVAGKHRNKIKVACARELTGFLWEALMTVAA